MRMRLTFGLPLAALVLAVLCTVASAEGGKDVPKGGKYTPPSWTIQLLLPPGGKLSFPAKADQSPARRDEVRWDATDSAAAKKAGLLRFAGWALPATTPDILELKDQDWADMLGQAVQGLTGEQQVVITDPASDVQALNHHMTWKRARLVSGTNAKPHFCVAYITYVSETYYVVVAEYSSSTATDKKAGPAAEPVLKKVVDPKT